jgi:flavin-dependent dehydrogenase
MSRQITIIGGGLAGLALANGLRLAEVPVEVFEAGFYPRHRVCGEFMAGLSGQTIRDLGLEGCFSDALRHRTVGFFRNGKVVRTYSLPATVPGISRYALDQRMARLLRERGGVLHEGKRRGPDEGAGIIRADGRAPRGGGYCGMKGHWGNLETRTDLELHLGDNAYVGLSKVETGDVNVCGLFGGIAQGDFESRSSRFNATLEQHGLSHLADRLAGADHRDGSLCSVSGLVYKQSDPKIASRIGDRLRLIPPFTGNGMTIAMESAAAVLPLLVDYARGKRQWEWFEAQSASLMRRQFAHRYRTARLLHPFLLAPALQSLLRALAHARLLPFPALYQLTHS